ncbi:hypothetical protein Nepgr_016204 [Nepenthes gracilis]|uniref:Major facilitator superfamily (MFS) profile domain-containing protein n=1 Tax=Nepenthes gracilis TaxID=150966 RepID=A0AAD3SN54_NEPGR|nr:hypothetical protein Nepgr_016204 [Nepenthes gracilis]
MLGIIDHSRGATNRANRSIARLPKSQEFNWNSAIVGLIQIFSFWGCLLTQIAGSLGVDKIGGKLVLGFGVIGWSVAIVLTPIAARINLPCLLILCVVMGMGEGVAMPAMNNIISILGGSNSRGPVILSRAPDARHQNRPYCAILGNNYPSDMGAYILQSKLKFHLMESGFSRCSTMADQGTVCICRRLDGRHICAQRPCSNISPEDHAIN